MVGTTMAFTAPASKLASVNIVEIENMLPLALNTPLYVSAVDLAPTCTAL
jgi:hypothetical protein